MTSQRTVSLLILCFFSLAAIGCPTTTRIVTTPEGADIHIDGEFVGKTPVIYHDRGSLPTRHRIQVALDGYRAEEFFIDRELSLLYAAVFGGASGVPLLWGWWMPSRMAISLRPLDESEPALEAETPGVDHEAPIERSPEVSPPAEPTAPSAEPAEPSAEPESVPEPEQEEEDQEEDDLQPPPPPPPPPPPAD